MNVPREERTQATGAKDALLFILSLNAESFFWCCKRLRHSHVLLVIVLGG